MNRYLFLAVLPALAACATTAENRVAYDPYEPYNRAVFAFNDKLDSAILVPTAKAYNKVVPAPARSGVSNFFNNLRDVVSLGSNLLRLDIEKASADLSRIGINIVFGLGGLIDIAGEAQMPNNKNTLGDTFATWGWKNSNYFILPFSAPSTVRDSFGDVALLAVPVEGALLQDSHDAVLVGVTALKYIDKRAKVVGLTDALEGAAPDRYAYVRDLYMNLRTRQTGGTLPETQQDGDSFDIDDLVAPEGGAELDIDDLVDPPADDSHTHTLPAEEQTSAPNIQAAPENVPAASESVQAASENVQAASENVQAASESVQAASESIQAASENVQTASEKFTAGFVHADCIDSTAPRNFLAQSPSGNPPSKHFEDFYF